MATRSLTEVYILMRNNALQNRHLFSDRDRDADDRVALVSKDDDVELGFPSSRSTRLPPEWVDGVEEVHFEYSRIKTKMKELSGLHDKHLHRPTLDDSVDEEHAIEILTQEVTQIFCHCQRLVKQICARSRAGTSQEQHLTANIVASLARGLQELSTTFRASQSSYLRKLKTREERSRQYFGDTDLMAGDGYVADESETLYDRGFSMVQIQEVEDNTEFVQQREREVTHIVRSIQDLNEIFKDVASMVVDQGTLLDRIDYNIEQTGSRVEEGLKHLQKAEKHQKKNRKMYCIMILFVIIIIMIIILLATKS